jgi:hypothetical protein
MDWHNSYVEMAKLGIENLQMHVQITYEMNEKNLFLPVLMRLLTYLVPCREAWTRDWTIRLELYEKFVARRHKIWGGISSTVSPQQRALRRTSIPHLKSRISVIYSIIFIWRWCLFQGQITFMITQEIIWYNQIILIWYNQIILAQYYSK